jgi:hypothetical protein
MYIVSQGHVVHSHLPRRTSGFGGVYFAARLGPDTLMIQRDTPQFSVMNPMSVLDIVAFDKTYTMAVFYQDLGFASCFFSIDASVWILSLISDVEYGQLINHLRCPSPFPCIYNHTNPPARTS